MTPGYATDRETSYVPRSAIVAPRAVNASMYQDMTNSYNRQHEPVSATINTMNTTNPPLKSNSFEIENFNRATKYGGIKLISNPNTVKGKESGKYFEEQPAFIGSVTATGGKSISFTNGSNGINTFNSSTGKVLNLNMR